MRRVLARRGLRILAAFTIGRRCEEVLRRVELGLLCEPPVRQEHKPKIKARRRKRGKGKKVRDVKPPKKKKLPKTYPCVFWIFIPERVLKEAPLGGVWTSNGKLWPYKPTPRTLLSGEFSVSRSPTYCRRHRKVDRCKEDIFRTEKTREFVQADRVKFIDKRNKELTACLIQCAYSGFGKYPLPGTKLSVWFEKKDLPSDLRNRVVVSVKQFAETRDKARAERTRQKELRAEKEKEEKGRPGRSDEERFDRFERGVADSSDEDWMDDGETYELYGDLAG